MAAALPPPDDDQRQARLDTVSCLIFNPALLPLPEDRTLPQNGHPKAILSWLLQLKGAEPTIFSSYSQMVSQRSGKTITKVRKPVPTHFADSIH